MNAPERVAESRETIARGRAPVIHPMDDDVLDPRIEGAIAIIALAPAPGRRRTVDVTAFG